MLRSPCYVRRSTSVYVRRSSCTFANVRVRRSRATFVRSRTRCGTSNDERRTTNVDDARERRRARARERRTTTFERRRRIDCLALPANAEQLDRSPALLATCYVIVLVLQLNPRLPLQPDELAAARGHDRPVLRRPPDGHLLRDPRAAPAARARALLAGVDQRRRAVVARRRGGGRRRRADVGEPAHASRSCSSRKRREAVTLGAGAPHGLRRALRRWWRSCGEAIGSAGRRGRSCLVARRRRPRSRRRWRSADAARCAPLDARPLDAALDVPPETPGAAGDDHRDRRRFARARDDGDRRGPAAELRADSRRRRRDAPGDAPSDVGRSRLGRGRDGQAAAEERRPIGRRSTCRRGGGDPIQSPARLLLRATASCASAC